MPQAASVEAERILANKRQVKGLLDAIANEPASKLKASLAAAYHKDARWRGSYPINELEGLAAIEARVWQPLLEAFPDLERRDSLIVGGATDGRDYVGMVGCYAGSFLKDWLGIPASGAVTYLRYGEVHQLQDGKIIESTVLLDVLDVIRQIGRWPLFMVIGGLGPGGPMGNFGLGSTEAWPVPFTGDGALLELRDPRESAESIALTLAMHQSLDNDVIDRPGLLRMSQKDYWHPKMMWYGPCGVGTGRGLEGFVDSHQWAFRQSFPKRRYGADHYVQIGDGKFSLTAGWPSVEAKHEGGAWLNLPITDQNIKMRVMDFYLIDEGRIRENWVPIDILHILVQMGWDPLARVVRNADAQP